MSRSNFLKDNEKIIQQKWGRNAFNADVAIEFNKNDKKKFFVTFPFPYSNACQHIGHAFTMLKADIMALYLLPNYPIQSICQNQKSTKKIQLYCLQINN